MVKEYAKIDNLLAVFIAVELKDRKRFCLEQLESFLIDKVGGISAYEAAGGYRGLYRIIKGKEKNGEIIPIKSSSYNGRRPPLKSRWQLNKDTELGWDDSFVFSMSRRLDITYYLKRPRLQTDELAERLIRLDKFLAEKEEREWASREERSLELFADEKYLSRSDGKKLLSRLKLDLADLKAEKYSQMFVYWNKGTTKKQGVGSPRKIKQALILENHSAFISCKRAIEAGHGIFSYQPDTLIYGGGKHIIDSFKFIEEIVDTGQVKIMYAGDIDPEGWQIYYNLRQKYPSYRLGLAHEYYRQMLLQGENGYPLQKSQQKNESVLKFIIREFREKGQSKLVTDGNTEEIIDKAPDNTKNNKKVGMTRAERQKEINEAVKRIKQLWFSDLRLPQELITFEVLSRKSC